MRNKKKTAPVAGAVKIPADSIGINVAQVSQIVAFRDDRAFQEIVKENPNMIALYGNTDDDREFFPGLYIAGIMDS